MTVYSVNNLSAGCLRPVTAQRKFDCKEDIFMSTPQNETLKRTLGMREAVTITVGTVVGVGLFTTGAQIVGSMGSAVILATFMRR